MRGKTTSTLFSVGLAFIASAIAVPHAAVAAMKWYPGHYCRASTGNQEGIQKWSIDPCKNVKQVRGYVVDLHWNSIEKQEGKYDLSIVDRTNQQAGGRKVIYRLADWGKAAWAAHVPDYMKASAYGGGYHVKNGNSYPKQWLKAYQERWHAYIRAVCRKVDKDKTTALVAFVESSRPQPAKDRTWSASAMADSFKQQAKVASDACKSTPVVSYLNYLPKIPRGLTNNLPYELQKLGTGLGTPDTVSYKNGKRVMNSSVFASAWRKFTQGSANAVPLAGEVQTGGFAGGSAEATFDYGVNEVGLNFFIWATGNRRPKAAGYTIYDVMDLLRKKGGQINARPPTHNRYRSTY